MLCSLEAPLVPGSAYLPSRTHHGRKGKRSSVQVISYKAPTKIRCSFSSYAVEALAPVLPKAGGPSSLLANMLAMGAQMMMHYLGLDEGIKATLLAPVMKTCPFLPHGVGVAVVGLISLIGLHVIISLAMKKCAAGWWTGTQTGTSATNLICIQNDGNWQGNVVVKNKETDPDVFPPS